ncbi:MAG: PASTA domain-containing protein [Actinobacteria bacterium]|nr:PASTA domain-containing protein [Actinomycetota bacterium]
MNIDNSEQRNSVIAQYPDAGEQIAFKDKIILFVGQ